jgi:hypothetical protein
MQAAYPMQTGAGYTFLERNVVPGVDATREEEVWTRAGERLLCEWSKEWHIRASKHEINRAWWKRLHLLLGIPSTVLPLFVAGLWGNLPEEEGSVTATLTMAVSGALGALMTFVQPEAQAERHLHATHRYADLISDVEEVLSKEPRFRTDSDVTVLSFKMRSDGLLRVSPPVRMSDAMADSSSDSEESRV